MAVVNNRNVDKATTAQAIAGTDDSTYMTPKTTAEAGNGERDAGNNVIGFANAQATAGDYTLAATKNMVIVGPFTISTGHTVTVETGARLVIL